MPVAPTCRPQARRHIGHVVHNATDSAAHSLPAQEARYPPVRDGFGEGEARRVRWIICSAMTATSSPRVPRRCSSSTTPYEKPRAKHSIAPGSGRTTLRNYAASSTGCQRCTRDQEFADNPLTAHPRKGKIRIRRLVKDLPACRSSYGLAWRFLNSPCSSHLNNDTPMKLRLNATVGRYGFGS